MLANGLDAHHLAVPTTLRTDHPPLTLSGPLLIGARIIWIAIALGAAALWFGEIPLYYRAALHFHSVSGFVNLRPSMWRAGLLGLGLSPSFYAAVAVTEACLQTWSMAVVALIMFIRRSNEWIALFISLTLVTFGASVIANSVGTQFASAHPQLNPLVQGYANGPYLAFFLIPLLFPDGRFVPRWSRWLLASCAFLFAAQAIAPGSVLDVSRWPVVLAGSLNVFIFGTVLLAPIYRYRSLSDPVQRAQTRWVVFGLVLAIGVFFALGLFQVLVRPQDSSPEHAVLFGLIAPAIALLGFTALPVCFGIAILRYRLWDIDLVLNRTLVYLALTASVLGLYVLVVAGLGTLLGAPGDIVLSLLATAFVAILFHPLHERLQRGVNRLLYGERNEPYAVLSRLGQRLEQTVAPGAVLSSIVETVAQALRLPYVAIAVEQDGQTVGTREAGTPQSNSLELPLVHGGETVGRLTLAPRPGEAGFAASDRRLLHDLARQAGIAVSAVRLTAELQRSRERLVTAREEERRRLRRDLHDGLGPALASQALALDGARKLLLTDPSAADALLADLTEHTKAAVEDIRRLVYALRPPALDELGLVPGLHEQAERYRQAALQIEVVAPEALPPLSAAVEVAVYRIVQEALTNVVRHANAAHASVRLCLDREVLIAEVRDDGQGIPVEIRAGVGLSSMRERAMELGGSCTVEPAAGGGTRVCARLPLIEEE